jgi:hypothetical protein
MRQLAKSAMSLGWALSLLGAKQAYGAVREGRTNRVDLFGPVTQAAVGQLDESMKRIHRSAENLESRLVDMACTLINPAQWLSPRGRNSAAQPGQPARGEVPQEDQPQPRPDPSHPGPVSPVTGDDGSFGWGPMPGDRSPEGAYQAAG